MNQNPLYRRRPFEPNKDCLGSDLLWSDPVMKKGTSESIRGIGTFFGPDVTQEFLGKDPTYLQGGTKRSKKCCKIENSAYVRMYICILYIRL